MPSARTDTTKAPSSAAEWSLIIRPHVSWWDLRLPEVWRNRDLLRLFVWRDFVTSYKQTILGPAWYVVQPLLTTLVFTVIFSGIARIPTDGVTPVVFYLSGITLWNYFAACLTKTSSTFLANAGLFGKVYFPRLIAPLSVVLSSTIQCGIQFFLLASVTAWYVHRGAAITPDVLLLIALAPVLVVLTALLGLGLGLVVSSLTAKYRDLSVLVGFGLQLAMFATPIIYPISAVPEGYRWIFELNPMASIVETFRAGWIGASVPWHSLAIAALITAGVMTAGLVLFNRAEHTFVDVV